MYELIWLINGSFDLKQEINLGKDKNEIKWTPFLYGWFAAIMPWVIIFIYFGHAANPDMPGFVYAIIVQFFFFMVSLPIYFFLTHFP